MLAPLAVQTGSVRALTWQHLDAAWRPRLGDAAWDALLAEAAAADPRRLDPFTDMPLAPFRTALGLLERRGQGLAVSGKAVAAAWGQQYRSLVRQLRGDPRRMLGVLASEVHPWTLHDAGAGRVVDAGECSLVLEMRGLPAAYCTGLIEGFVALTGVEGAHVASQGEGRFAVSWEAAQAAARRPSTFALLARAVRAPMLPATLVPVLVGAAVAVQDGFLAVPLLALTLLGVALLQLGANAANDYFDRRADDANVTPTRFSGGSRVIQRGLLSARAMLGIAGALFAAGAVLGLLLAATLPSAAMLPVLGLGAAGALLGLAYTAPPLRLAHRGLGELAVGLGFGPLVMAGAYLVQRAAATGEATVTPLVWALSLPMGALVAAGLYVNEFPDKPWDAQAGKRTLVVRLDARRALLGYGLLIGLAYASIAAAALAFGAPLLLLGLLTLPLAFRAWQGLKAHHAAPFRLAGASAATSLLHITTGLLLCVALHAGGL